MSNEMSTFVELWLLDTEIDRLVDQRSDAKQRIERRAAHLSDANERYLAVLSESQLSKLALSEAENSMTSIDRQKALLNNAVLTGTVNHEDAMSQLTTLDLQYDDLLEKWSMLDSKVTELLPQDAFVAKERISSHQRALQVEENESARVNTHIATRLMALQEQKQQVASRLNPSLVESYVRARDVRKPAVAFLSSNICPRCNLQISSQVAYDVQSRAVIRKCGSCRIFLVSRNSM